MVERKPPLRHIIMSEELTIQTILKVSPNLLILATAGAAHFGMTLEEAMRYPFVNQKYSPAPGIANEHPAEKEAAAQKEAEREDYARRPKTDAERRAAVFALADRMAGKSSPRK